MQNYIYTNEVLLRETKNEQPNNKYKSKSEYYLHNLLEHNLHTSKVNISTPHKL